MIYLRLHQARNEEIDREQAGARGRNFTIVAKFRYVAKFSAPCFCVQTTSFLVNFISTLTVIILVRLDWYFHLFVRLYKPFFELFVT